MEIIEENNSGIKKDIPWYIGLIIAFALLLTYWKTYFEISSITEIVLPLFPKFALVIIILFLFKVFIKLSLPLLKRGVSLYFKAGEWRVIRMLYIYMLWMVALLIIISGIFGSFTSLGISLSVIGAGVAFALQHVILSFAGWFLIIIKRPYRIGDRIYIKGKDILGDVEDITMLYTVLKEVASNDTATGKNVIIPNGTVFLEPIINYSYDVPHIWVPIPVSVTYESDLGLAEKIIFDVASEVAGGEMKMAANMIRRKTPESVQIEFAADEPVIRVEFADSSITVRVRILCLPKRVPALKTEIFRRIFEEFNKPENKDKVEIAYPHMELVLHDEVMGERFKTYLDRRPPV